MKDYFFTRLFCGISTLVVIFLCITAGYVKITRTSRLTKSYCHIINHAINHTWCRTLSTFRECYNGNVLVDIPGVISGVSVYAWNDYNASNVREYLDTHFFLNSIQTCFYETKHSSTIYFSICEGEISVAFYCLIISICYMILGVLFELRISKTVIKVAGSFLILRLIVFLVMILHNNNNNNNNNHCSIFDYPVWIICISCIIISLQIVISVMTIFKKSKQ